MAQDSRTNWSQVCLAALASNVATGLAFGSFGTLILSIETEYQASRATSSLALSLLIVSLSATALILGTVLDRISIRKTMVAGAILGSLGFLAAALAQNALQLQAAYLLLLGPATAMMGMLPANTLASRWSTADRRGRALGLVNMPLLVMVVPITIVPLLESFGPRGVYGALAMADLALLPFLLAIKDGNPPSPAEGSIASAPPTTARALMRRPVFWTLIVCQGLLVGAGTMKLAHFVPLLTEQGRTFQEANLLLALSGGAGILGSFAFGILGDRYGGIRALVLNALVQAAMWTIFLAPVSFGVLLADAIVVGACGAGVQTAFCVALPRLFGERNFSLALGLASLLTLPFLFGLTPIASLLYEASGGYELPMGAMIGGFILAAGLLLTLLRAEARDMSRSREVGN